MPLGLFLFLLFSIFWVVTCPRPPVFARPNILVASFATQARACILSDHNIFYAPRGGGNGGVMPLGLFLLHCNYFLVVIYLIIYLFETLRAPWVSEAEAESWLRKEANPLSLSISIQILLTGFVYILLSIGWNNRCVETSRHYILKLVIISSSLMTC